MHKAPGQAHRKGISLFQATQMFSTEDKAEAWFVKQRWGRKDRIRCPHCDSKRIQTKANRKPQPWRCLECKRHFSVKTNTFMHASNIPLAKWGLAIYLFTTSLKGVSSMKLHRDLGISQTSAWHMAHRIRKGWSDAHRKFAGPVEADEAYIGGKEDRKHEYKRLNPGGGAKGKAAVAGIKDRATNQVQARVIDRADADTLTQFVHQHSEKDALVFTDESPAYNRLNRAHFAVKHSVKEFVNGMAHTNGMESFWATIKRAYVGVYHHFSEKHLQRYIDEFTGRHNLRPLDTEEQMGLMVQLGVGQTLRFIDLIGPKHTRQPQML